jgi:SOS-response transcriptional repressor LexA
MGWTQAQLADRLGVSKQSVSNWETGLKTPRMGMIQNLSALFNVPVSQMLDNPDFSQIPAIDTVTDIMNNLESSRQRKVVTYAQGQLDEQNGKVVTFPTPEVHESVEVYGCVSAGTGEYLTGDDYKETVSYNGPVPEHDFAVRVNGDSMEPMFENGQIIFVRESTGDDIHSGQIVIAVLNEEAYVKKIDLDGGVRLISLNSKYDPICINEDDEFSVQGVVVL